MVWPGRLVAERHRCFLAQKERSIGKEPLAPPGQIGGLHMQMLRCFHVGILRHFLACVAEDHLGEIGPGGSCRRAVYLGEIGDEMGTMRRTSSANVRCVVASQTGLVAPCSA